ncbi:DUF3078 domain-containing protein [Aequorivita xiaoshiensis]|uniref:DUF3078 domain-containing protein n=1 Tax=Aequorivita xiaoshiensis TaxID=2874476 RepID=A0A9X1U646_9FLAO|nr:DUF3078 domain-containing protein [Aequorivita xiaoshiensis]MCG2430857.1 DUF3078 domain-containing protein [Aequorivita xiaoshiensis]
MKYTLWLIFPFLILNSYNLKAHTDSLKVKIKKKDTVDLGWRTKNEVGLLLNQVSFTNWNSGGTNSISGIVSTKSVARYKQENWLWNSELNLKYGLNKQEDNGVKKTEDVIDLNSNVVLQTDSISNWFYSARFSFNTQFSNGYKYPNKDEAISRFLAPGYMFFGVGMEYGKKIEHLSFYASPFTLKTTFVMDDHLANRGAFGVNPAIYDMDGNMLSKGNNIKQEVGILLTNKYEEKIFENIKLNSHLRLYTDYVNSFGNIDIDWEVNIDMKVNKFVKATLGSHLRYDNDIKVESKRNEITNEEIILEGPSVQWKQILGIGVVIDFDKLSKSKETS